jgi:hypothetical protein
VYATEVRRRAIELLQCEGMTVSQVSRQLGISRAALRDWRERGVIARFPSECPQRAEGREYAALLGFYLGDGCLSTMERTTMLRVSCDMTYPGIIQDVSDCILAVHPDRPVHRVRAPGVVIVQNYWQHWPCLFPQHGPGRKHERLLGMADWQQAVIEAYPADFLRGLFHSAGCRANNWTRRMVAGQMKRYDYPRWQFTNNSQEIRDWCCGALDMVGIAWRQSNWKTISVARRNDVQRLDDLLGLKA